MPILTQARVEQIDHFISGLLGSTPTLRVERRFPLLGCNPPLKRLLLFNKTCGRQIWPPALQCQHIASVNTWVKPVYRDASTPVTNCMLGPQAFGPIRFFVQVELACVIKSTKGIVSLESRDPRNFIIWS